MNTSYVICTYRPRPGREYYVTAGNDSRAATNKLSNYTFVEGGFATLDEAMLKAHLLNSVAAEDANSDKAVLEVDVTIRPTSREDHEDNLI